MQGSGGSGAGWSGALGHDGGGNLDADPQRGPLQDNGGHTPTRMIAPASPALDASTFAPPPPVADQRGVARPQPAAGAFDIGALERQAIEDHLFNSGFEW